VAHGGQELQLVPADLLQFGIERIGPLLFGGCVLDQRAQLLVGVGKLAVHRGKRLEDLHADEDIADQAGGDGGQDRVERRAAERLDQVAHAADAQQQRRDAQHAAPVSPPAPDQDQRQQQVGDAQEDGDATGRRDVHRVHQRAEGD